MDGKDKAEYYSPPPYAGDNKQICHKRYTRPLSLYYIHDLLAIWNFLGGSEKQKSELVQDVLFIKKKFQNFDYMIQVKNTKL